MTTYARIQNGEAVEIFTPPEGFTLEECFHADVAALFVEVPDGTLMGATTTDGGKTWVSPEASSVTPAVAYGLLTPMQFYLAFKPKERQLIKALASDDGIPATSPLNPTPGTAIPQDIDVEEFWATYEIALQEKSNIDPNLPSIQEGLEYLAAPAAPTPAVIAADRIPEILAGVAQ